MGWGGVGLDGMEWNGEVWAGMEWGRKERGWDGFGPGRMRSGV